MKTLCPSIFFVVHTVVQAGGLHSTEMSSCVIITDSPESGGANGNSQ